MLYRDKAKELREAAIMLIRGNIMKVMNESSNTQSQLADKLGIDYPTVYAWKNQKYLPKPWMAWQMEEMTDGAVKKEHILPHVFLNPTSEDAGSIIEKANQAEQEQA